MGIKTFQAPSMKEALALARQGMGDDACILSATSCRWFGEDGKWENEIEVTATIGLMEREMGDSEYRTGVANAC